MNMQKVVIVLGVIVALMWLGIVGWLTDGSTVAFLAAVVLFVLVAILAAGQFGGLAQVTPTVDSIITWGALFCAMVIIWATIGNLWEKKVRPARNKARAERQARKEAVATSLPTFASPSHEALVLEDECFTPCNTTKIAWPFQIIWGNAPLRIIYPGNQVVDRYGEDTDFKAPESMSMGKIQFISLDPSRPKFRVQIYRITTAN